LLPVRGLKKDNAITANCRCGRCTLAGKKPLTATKAGLTPIVNTKLTLTSKTDADKLNRLNAEPLLLTDAELMVD
jgi:hypothetical protein